MAVTDAAAADAAITHASPADSNRAGAKPFGLFEWMVARRYISATRKGAGVSLISIIAFAGILLAVAVLIIVMSIMQGFRAKLLDQLLSVNGWQRSKKEASFKIFDNKGNGRTHECIVLL